MLFPEYALMATLWLQITDTLVSRLQKTDRWKRYFVIFGILILTFKLTLLEVWKFVYANGSFFIKFVTQNMVKTENREKGFSTARFL